MGASTGQVVERIRGEYSEMPGLRLTVAQAQRLWGLDRRTTEVVLKDLVDSHFLRCTHEGAFVRTSD